MTHQKEIERLARFMGYEYVPEEGQSGCSEHWGPIDDDGSKPHWGEFNPFTSIEDAMMMAEKISGLDLFNFCADKTAGWVASFWCGDTESRKCVAATPAEAMALAALAYLDATESKGSR